MNPFDNIKKKNPFDQIEQKSKQLFEGDIGKVIGNEQFNATKTGVALNTLFGIPKTALNFVAPSRGYTEKELRQSQPTFTERVKAIPKLTAELATIGEIAGDVPVLQKASETKVGSKLADWGQKISDFAKPQTVGEAAAMRIADVVTAIPAGTIRSVTPTATKIAKNTDIKTIFNILKKEFPDLTDDVAEVYSKVLSTVDNADDVQRILPNKATPETSLQQQILEARRAKELEYATETAELPSEFPNQAKEIRDMAETIDWGEISKWKDIGNIKKQFRDIYRNTEQVFGPKNYEIIDKNLLEPFNQAKGANIDTLNLWINNLKNNVVNKFNWNRGSKESAAIQLLGESKMSFDDVVKKFGQEKANNIAEAERWFRQAYDNHIEALNKIEQQIYPTSPWKWTPKRADYFRHFQETSSDFSRLQNILENPIRIDPALSGISETTAPKTRWASFKQQRQGNKTKNDAIGGYLDYLPSWSKAVNIDPFIGKFRELADVLERGTKESKNLNNYIYNLRKFANELAGKTPELDRIVTDYIGRTPLQVLDWTNRQVKSNTILYNATASWAQIYNIPQGIVSAGPINSSKGMVRTLGQFFTNNVPMEKSNFLKERFFKGFQEFDKGILNNSKKFGAWMVTVLDEVGTRFVWNGQYEKALTLGIKDPIKFADDATKKLVAGRGIGEKPLTQNSKVFQLFAPFQLEVTNLWWVMEDMAKSDKSIMKKFGQFASLFITIHLFNDLSEKITGNRIALDPIQAVKDGIEILKNDKFLGGVVKAGGRLAGEIFSNIPFGQTIASVYPEYGANIFGKKTPSRRELFGKSDPTRYGGGLLTTKALSDPLYKIVLPFGGGQLKKSIQGVRAVRKGKSTNIEGDWQYKIDKNVPNLFRASLFGKPGLPETQAYYRKKNNPKKTSSGKNPFDN